MWNDFQGSLIYQLISVIVCFICHMVRKKDQGIEAQNVTPHLLSHGGYYKLEQTMIKEKEKARSTITSKNDIEVSEPPSPPKMEVSKYEKIECI